MTFLETFAGVFTAQLLIWICGWIIKTYIEPKWNKTHKRIKIIIKGDETK